MLCLHLHNDLECLTRLQAAKAAWAETVGLDRDESLLMQVVLEEVVGNIIRYAYPVGQTGPVSVQIEQQPGELLIRVCDAGIPFNPTQQPPPDLDSALEDRQIGGLGWHLVRSLVDAIEYQRCGGENVLCLRKRWLGGNQ